RGRSKIRMKIPRRTAPVIFRPLCFFMDNTRSRLGEGRKSLLHITGIVPMLSLQDVKSNAAERFFRRLFRSLGQVAGQPRLPLAAASDTAERMMDKAEISFCPGVFLVNSCTLLRMPEHTS